MSGSGHFPRQQFSAYLALIRFGLLLKAAWGLAQMSTPRDRGTRRNFSHFIGLDVRGREARMSEQSDKVDIERAAFGLIRNYGDKAEQECALLVTRWEARGDDQAARLWRGALDVIRKTADAPD